MQRRFIVLAHACMQYASGGSNDQADISARLLLLRPKWKTLARQVNRIEGSIIQPGLRPVLGRRGARPRSPWASNPCNRTAPMRPQAYKPTAHGRSTVTKFLCRRGRGTWYATRERFLHFGSKINPWIWIGVDEPGSRVEGGEPILRDYEPEAGTANGGASVSPPSIRQLPLQGLVWPPHLPTPVGSLNRHPCVFVASSTEFASPIPIPRCVVLPW
jgi:hypothetical protein